MRVKLAIILSAVTLALAGIGATAAFAAAGGNEKSNKGKSDAAHANHGPSASQSDPSNPDGTYQGKSPSKPDQDGIGADHGIDNNDKSGPGTDGNNGCGNDPDREDDNNGWCGDRPKHEKPETPPSVAPTVTPPSGGNGTEVLGETFTKPPAVLGRNLARTGVAVMMFAALALMLGGIGFALRAVARPRRAE